MGKKSLTLEQVFDIRKGGNPDRVFAPNTYLHDLENKSYLDIVDVFNNRISKWYFDVAEFVYKKTDYNFSIIIFCCIIIDLLSQYIFAVPSSSERTFKNFFREYLKQYNHLINPPIITCYFSNKNNKWLQEEIKDIADGFYHCFRCGVVHSGRILEYGRINTRYPDEVIKIIEWEKGKREINVNTIELPRKLKIIFNDYIEKLKSEESPFKQNFISKFKLEHGIEVK
jgi:hypothetical protein